MLLSVGFLVGVVVGLAIATTVNLDLGAIDGLVVVVTVGLIVGLTIDFVISVQEFVVSHLFTVKQACVIAGDVCASLRVDAFVGYTDM